MKTQYEEQVRSDFWRVYYYSPTIRGIKSVRLETEQDAREYLAEKKAAGRKKLRLFHEKEVRQMTEYLGVE